MDTNLTILLVEDDQNACDEIEHYIETLATVDLIGITNHSSEALSLVESHLPDAVILDLELHQGGGNGIQFLIELAGLHLPYRPYILVTTNNSSDITYETVRKYGADFIMYKHESNYSGPYVVDFLQTIHPVILSTHKVSSPIAFKPESPESKQSKLTQRIGKEMDLIGISRKSVAFPYLIDAILLIKDHPETNILSHLARKYAKSESSIERAMRYAIHRAWLTSPIEELETHYTAKTHSHRGTPTTMEFIYYYADKLKNSIRSL